MFLQTMSMIHTLRLKIEYFLIPFEKWKDLMPIIPTKSFRYSIKSWGKVYGKGHGF